MPWADMHLEVGAAQALGIACNTALRLGLALPVAEILPCIQQMHEA